MPSQLEAVYPVWTGFAGGVTVPPYSTFIVAIVLFVCPSINVTAYVLVDHCAYSVTISFGDAERFFTDSLFLYAVPVPFSFVFHPLNDALGDENPFAVRFFDTSYVIDMDAVVPEASFLFLLNCILYRFGVH